VFFNQYVVISQQESQLSPKDPSDALYQLTAVNRKSSLIFAARRYASALYAVVMCLSDVRHKPALYQNG